MTEFSDTVQQITNDYAQEFGQRKLDRIISRVERSKKVARFIERARREQEVPIHDVLPMVHEIPWFSFAKPFTIAIAATVVMALWNQRCNPNEELISDYDLGLLMRDVYQKIGRIYRS